MPDQPNPRPSLIPATRAASADSAERVRQALDAFDSLLLTIDRSEDLERVKREAEAYRAALEFAEEPVLAPALDVRRRALTDAGEAVHFATAPLGGSSPWNDGFSAARKAALAALRDLRDGVGR